MFGRAAIITSLALGAFAASSVPVVAQQAAAPSVKLEVGTTVYDSEGAAIGPVTNNDGTNVVIKMGESQIALPIRSFGSTEKGAALGITSAQLAAGIEQQKAAAAAALTAALQPGTEVRSVKGTAIVGKVKLVEPAGVVLATSQGDVRLPANAFFMSAQGLATSFTADEFAAAIAAGNSSAQAGTSGEAKATSSDEAAK